MRNANVVFWFSVVFVVLVFLPGRAAAEVRVDDLEFCTDISSDKEHIGDLRPLARCCGVEVLEDSQVTVVDSRMHRKVYFWNRIQADRYVTLVHSWCLEGAPAEMKRTRMSTWDRKFMFIDSFQFGLSSKIAEVLFKIKPSGSYRTWSSKTIDPAKHKGRWRVIVSTRDRPDESLCTAYLIIK